MTYVGKDGLVMSMQVHRHLFKQLSRLRLDFEGALAELKTYDDYSPHEEAALALIRDGVWRCKICEYGKVHTPLTNLRPSLRPYLSVDGSHLVNLGLKNSLPLLFARLLKQHLGSHLPADARHYIELVEQGLLYDHLMSQAGIPDTDRESFKESFFASVFFCPNFPITERAMAFGQEFPHVFAYIRHEKALDHAALARELQRNESEIMIRRICSRIATLMPKAFLGTIHDSLLVKPEDAQDILGIMRHEFSLDGLNPTIRVEDLSR